MAAIIALFLQYLPALLEASKSVPDIITFVSKIHGIFKRTKSWTPDQEAEFDISLEHLKDDPYWKPEA